MLNKNQLSRKSNEALVEDSQAPILDVTSRASAMAPNSALLYRNRRPRDANSPSYIGVLKMTDGNTFWAGVWMRTINGKPAIELRLVPRKERRRE